ncbi:hypothetical protein DSO57_1008891 [Entomophthora muscae]|uniref:Uncharacterized protein n=1 Tax=Entomophthora muscae TaxID=34485 RepID=A0ACC2TVI7_9FUNG|nr:hypothetical protein DSO57_1008891 [Entomophthora muscae]
MVYPIVGSLHISPQLDRACSTAVVQKSNLDNVAQMATAAVENSTCEAASLITLEKMLHHLWAKKPPVESEADNSQDGSGGTTLSGISSNYKPTFNQVFNPKTFTIAAFLTIYETATRHAPDELKQEHILTCLPPVCQELVVPELANIASWAQMKEMLIENLVVV